MQPSDLSLSGSASVNGFYGITAKGNNHFRGNKSRLSYRLQFPSFKELKLQHTLPNYGLGLRVEFKHNVNIRIDYGFGKDTAGFVFQFAEAF